MATTLADLMVKIGADSSGLQKELKASQRQIKSFFGDISISQKALASIEIAAAGIIGLGVASLNAASNQKSLSNAFKALAGDSADTKSALSALSDVAENSIYGADKIKDLGKQMLAVGFDAGDISPILQTVGDAVTYLGGGSDKVADIVKVLEKVRIEGNLTKKSMRALSLDGVQAYQYLANATGMSMDEVHTAVEKGTIDSTTAINAFLQGMQAQFSGGMNNAIANKASAAFQALKNTADETLLAIGDDIANSGVAGGLASVLNVARNELKDFKADVESFGIGQAIKDMFPDWALMTITAFAGAIVGTAVPAIALVGLQLSATAATLGIAFAPFIAAGIAIGAAAAFIWYKWEPLTEYFSALWDTLSALAVDGCDLIYDVINTITDGLLDTIVNACGNAVDITDISWSGIADTISDIWEDIKSTVASGVNWVLNKLQDLLSLINSISPVAGKLLSDLANNVGKTGNALSSIFADEQKPATEEQMRLLKGDTSTADAKKDKVIIKPSATDFAKSSGGGGSGGGGGGGESAIDKLGKKSDEITKQITKQWDDVTKSSLEQLDIWYNEEVGKLDNMAAQYAENGEDFTDYEADKTKINEIYSFRRRKIIADEAKKALETYQQIRDGYSNMQKDITLTYLDGSSKENAQRKYDLNDKLESVQNYFRKIEDQYNTGTATEQKYVTDALQKEGIAYETLEGNRISLAKAAGAQAAAYEQKYAKDTADYYSHLKDLESDVEAAYYSRSFARLQKLLSEENAARLAAYNEDETIMKDYYDTWVTANESISSQFADMIMSGQQSFSTFFENIMTGAETFSNSFKTLFSDLWKNIVDSLGGKLSGQIANGLLSALGLDNDKKKNKKNNSGNNNTGSNNDSLISNLGTDSSSPTISASGGGNDAIGNSYVSTGSAISASGGGDATTEALSGVATVASGLSAAFGGLGSGVATATGLISVYEGVQAIINSVTKPTETGTTAAATAALTAFTAAVAAASVALEEMSFETSFAFLATGGAISGAGTGTSDSIPAWLSNGEYVMNARSVNKYGTGFFNRLNKGLLPKFASGGIVTGPSLASLSKRFKTVAGSLSGNASLSIAGHNSTAALTIYGDVKQDMPLSEAVKSLGQLTRRAARRR